MTVFYEFDEVDAFVALTVGEPGARVFFLHARRGDERVTVRCEKQQVGAIAEYLNKVLSDLPPAPDRSFPVVVDPATVVGTELFVLGPIGLGYDRANDRLVIQLDSFVPPSEDDDPDADDLDEDRDRVRCSVTRAQAAAFCERAVELIAAGRPTCVWCALPIDPDGHPCPRMN